MITYRLRLRAKINFPPFHLNSKKYPKSTHKIKSFLHMFVDDFNNEINLVDMKNCIKMFNTSILKCT